MDEIAALLRKQPLGHPLLLLVPEQQSFEAQRRLVSSPGITGMIRADVLGFHRLAHRIMQETGGSSTIPVCTAGKHMLFYKIIQKTKHHLHVFRNTAHHLYPTLGFVRQLNTLHTELKKYAVDVVQLFERVNDPTVSMNDEVPCSLHEKLKDIFCIYQQFEHELSDLYTDEEDTLSLLAERLNISNYVSGADVWIDGFREFTTQELKVVGQLMRYAGSVTISLTLDRPYAADEVLSDFHLFHQSARAYTRLKQLAQFFGLDTHTVVLPSDRLPRFMHRPSLAYLEKQFSGRTEDRRRNQVNDGIHIYRADNKKTEVEGALREIRRLAQQEGARYKEMVLLVRHLEHYADVVESLCEDYEIPLFIDHKRPQPHHPLTQFICSSFDIIRYAWTYEHVFQWIKTGFCLPIDGSITHEHMDAFENHVLAFGIHGRRFAHERIWQTNDLTSDKTSDTNDDYRLEEKCIMMERCRRLVVDALLPFEQRMKDAKTVEQQCIALYLLLEETKAADKLSLLAAESISGANVARAVQHEQMWKATVDVLDQMVEMIGEQNVDQSVFAEMVQVGLMSIQLSLVPPCLDQVLMGSIDRTHPHGVKYVFLLGFGHGIVPAIPQDDGVLTEQERQWIGNCGIQLGPPLTRKLLDEQFLIYQALTLASDQLWVSYCAVDEEGKRILPSETIRYIQKTFSMVEKRLAADPLPHAPQAEHVQYVVHPNQSLSHLIVQLMRWYHGELIPDVWWDVYNWHLSNPATSSKLSRCVGAIFYTNETSFLSEEMSRRLYGKKLTASVSRLERFSACPFAHFSSYGLKLSERKLYRLRAPDVGQLFHAALNDMGTNLRKRHINWGELTTEQCAEQAKLAFEHVAGSFQNKILLSNNRYRYIYRKLQNTLVQACIVLGQHARQSQFELLALELDFGPEKTLPPLHIQLDKGGELQLVGRIDRVDVSQGSRGLLLRVIDYKSSKMDMKLHEVYHGLCLQMVAYLYVLLTHSEQWLGECAKPAGVLYFHIHHPFIHLMSDENDRQVQAELVKAFKMKGLVSANIDVIRQMDTALDRGHSVMLPVSLKADGSFYEHASVATVDQWEQLFVSVERSIRHIGNRMMQGDVGVKPYRIGSKIACAFCSFQPVCQFDRTSVNNNYVDLNAMSKQKTWQLLGQLSGGSYENEYVHIST